jgi:ATP-binding cassette subfamily C (CFTR/MRP) protein 1
VTQDPVIYSGTVRDNLDPFRVYQESQLMSALEKAHFLRTVNTKFGGLNGKLGGFMSNGEKAQIGLARSLVKNSKVLLIDEATASIDLVTDVKIQRSLKSLGGCTILTIAHRLHTIIDYNRIMVLSAGSIAELNTPFKLMSDEHTIFHSMVMELGLDVFRNLK